MTSSIKDIAKIGMRNPYLIEILTYWGHEHEQAEPFAIEKLRKEYAIV